MALMKTRRGALAATVAGNALYPLLSQGALTLSAGVITDVTRLAGVQGDGATYPASMAGVWPAATNLVTNGGFETDTTGWSLGGGGETIVRTTAEAKFGAAALSVTTPATAFRGTSQVSGYWQPVTPGTTYTAGAWVKYPAGTNARMNVTDREAGGASPGVTSVNFVATGEWQRVSNTRTAAATAATQQIGFFITDATALTFYVDGVSHYASAIDMPYIETDGGTASRVAGDCYASTFSSLVNPTKGWMFVRGRFGVSDAAAPSGGYGLAECNRSDGTSRTTLTWTPAVNQLNVARVGGGSSGSLGGSPAITPALGDHVTAGMGWSASLIGAATNGNAFNTQADTNIGGAFDRINFGSRRSGSPFYGDILWAVIGSEDTWDTALSVLMHSFGNNDPLPHQIPRRYGPVVLATMNGDGTMYRYAA